MSPPPRVPEGPGRRRLAAFTLVEIVAVLLILGLLAGVVAVSVRGRDARTKMSDVVGRLVALDAEARAHARRFRRASQLVFDLRSGRVSVAAVGGGSGLDGPREARGLAVELPRGFELREVRTRARAIRDGEVGLPCSALGQTPSYALSITGPAGQSELVLVAGLTGEITSPDSEASVDAVMRTLQPAQAKGGRDPR